MRIGIYKPFKKVFFHDDAEDNAAWSYEVVNIAKILARYTNEIYILSDTDLVENNFSNIHTGLLNTTYDRIIVFGGSFNLDKYGDGIINQLHNITNRLDFYLTDLKLVPTDLSSMLLFDNIYIMSYQPVESLGEVSRQKYGGGPELRLLDHMQTTHDKRVQFYFGGTERGRLDAFLEYVWRPDHIVTTKSSFLQLDTRNDRNEFLEMLSQTKYSICIADELFNKNHYLTPRMYEAWVNDIVCFVDNNYDDMGIIVPLDSYLRVNSYKEMKTKMNELDANIEKYNDIIDWQRSQITIDKVDGSFVYKLIS